MTTPAEERGDDIFVAVYNQVYNQIEFIAKKKALDVSNLDEVIKVTMEAIDFLSNDVKTLSGTQKSEIARQVIVAILKDLIKRKKLKEEVGQGIIAGVQLLGPTIFKLVALASKGMINLIHGNSPQPNGVAKPKCCSIV